ncbi:unnamed protein product [Urochloa decumbens]|uniref:Uncharacterized protein n=1 Tax=Urochloa decumbens TaxID=240449 RepID=A0ABC9B4F2_9POAL
MGNSSSSSSAAAAATAALAGCSKSTILAVPDTETGSHVLTVDGYTMTRGRGVGNSINSGTFTVGDHNWHIAYYPDGSRRSYPQYNWISVNVYHDGPAAGTNSGGGVKAHFELNILKPNGKPVSTYRRTSPVISFSGDGQQCWGQAEFITNDEIRLIKHIARHNSFLIRCDVTVIRENRVETTVSPSLIVPPPDLHQHLANLLETQVGADVTFDVGGELFKAHRAVLATRSTVFMAELFGNMKEKAASCVKIDDVDPNAFRAMLHFIYTDSLPKIEDGDMMVMAQHLLVTADKYNLERLKLICEDKLCTYIDSKTVVNTLLLADQHGCKCLQEECLRFVKSRGNFKSVMACDDFEHLMSSYPSLVKELLAKVAH